MLQGAKGLVAKLGPPYVKSAWGSKGKRVRVARLAVCCNYFSKKKKQLCYKVNILYQYLFVSMCLKILV